MYIKLKNDFHVFKLNFCFEKNHQWTSLKAFSVKKRKPFRMSCTDQRVYQPMLIKTLASIISPY